MSEYPKLEEIWQELKWLFYGGENGFQGNRGNGKLLKRCQNRGLDRSNSGNIGNYLKMCKREILQNVYMRTLVAFSMFPKYSLVIY